MRDVARFVPLRKVLSSIWRAFYFFIGILTLFYLVTFYLVGERKSESAQKIVHSAPSHRSSRDEATSTTNLNPAVVTSPVPSGVTVSNKKLVPVIETFYKTVEIAVIKKKTLPPPPPPPPSTTTAITTSTTTEKRKTVSIAPLPPPNARDIEHLQEKLKAQAQIVTPAGVDDSAKATSHHEDKHRIVQESVRPDYIKDGQCPVVSCQEGQSAIYLQSGYRLNVCPMLCWQGMNLVEHNYSQKCPESARGLHIIVIQSTPVEKVKAKKVFDTYTRDEDLMDFLLGPSVATGDVILAATFDESSTMLQDNTRTVLAYFGSQYIQNIRFRDTFVMVGQKGIEKGAAFEALRHKRIDEDFAYPVTLSICAKFPIATVAQLPPADSLRQLGSNVRIGAMSHCNVDSSCPSPATIPVFLSSGNGNKGDPQLCVNSRLVFHPIMKIGKRGYNLAEYDPVNQEIVTRDAFDGYTEEPTRLVIFLDQIADGNLLLGVVHDDASVRQLAYYFEAFGVTVVQQVRYRSVAWFVGQRGAKHAFQQISQSPNGKDYAPPVSFRACIPTQVIGLRHPDELQVNSSTTQTETLLSHENMVEAEERRTHFCSRFVGFPELCTQNNQIVRQMMPDVLDPLIVKQWRAVEESDVESVPIVVMCGSDSSKLLLTLQTLANQPGLRRDLVTVVVADIIANDELRALVTAFQFHIEQVAVASYQELYLTALENASSLAEQKKVDAFIFIEPDVVLSPDFFIYLSSVYPLFIEDTSLGGISAWNHNGYEFFSHDANATYLSETALPSPCFLMRNGYFTKTVKPNYEKCCGDKKSRFLPWKFTSPSPFLVPEISRCFKTPPAVAIAQGVEFEGRLIEALFFHPRRTSLNVPPPLSRSDVIKMFGHLKVSSYGDYLNKAINQSIIVRVESNEDKCDFVKGSYQMMTTTSPTDRVKYVVPFKQKTKSDWSELHELAKCFGLNVLELTSEPTATKDEVIVPFGVYKETFRFSTPTAEYFLVSNISPFFHIKNF